MTQNEVTPEAVPGEDPTAWGTYGPVRVEMHDTLGAIALATISLLLLRELLICRRNKG